MNGYIRHLDMRIQRALRGLGDMDNIKMDGVEIKWSYNDTRTIIRGETSAHVMYVVTILDDGIKAQAYIPSVREDKNPVLVFSAGGCFDTRLAIDACKKHLSEIESGRCVDMLKAKIEEKEAQAKEIGDCLTYLRSRLAITMIYKQEQ